MGVDGSDASIAALRRGSQLALALELPLDAVTAWEYPVFFSPFDTSELPIHVEASRALDDAVDRAFQGHPSVRVTKTLLEGQPARALIEHSRDAYLLVLGNRGLGGFARLLLGSVSSACVSHARCPVLIMRTPEDD